MKLLVMQFFSTLPSPHPSSTPCSQTPSVYVPLQHHVLKHPQSVPPQHPVCSSSAPCSQTPSVLFSNTLSLCSSSAPCSQTPSVYVPLQHPVLKHPQSMFLLSTLFSNTLSLRSSSAPCSQTLSVYVQLMGRRFNYKPIWIKTGTAHKFQ
jgi:hypothetical protein